MMEGGEWDRKWQEKTAITDNTIQYSTIVY